MTRISFDPRITGRPIGLPPSSAIGDPAVSKALAEYETVAEQVRADSLELERLTRQRAAAQVKDRQQQATALARGRDVDATTASDELESKIDRSRRRYEARRLLRDQSLAAIEKLLADDVGTISHASAQRLISARRRWLRALDKVGEALIELDQEAAADRWLRAGGKYVASPAVVRTRRDDNVLVSDMLEQLRTLHSASASAPEPVAAELEAVEAV